MIRISKYACAFNLSFFESLKLDDGFFKKFHSLKFIIKSVIINTIHIRDFFLDTLVSEK